MGRAGRPPPRAAAPLDFDDAGKITSSAGYLAKYATKATELAGQTSKRLQHDTVRDYARLDPHPGGQIDTCWHLGTAPDGLDDGAREDWRASWGRLLRWAHMLGFGGHFSSRSRRYFTTLGALRQARRDWRRAYVPHPDEDEELAGEDTTEVVLNSLAFAGIGWHTSADALLANTSAANARARRMRPRRRPLQPDQETKMSTTHERLWGTADVSAYLGVAVNTLCQWRHEGYGPAGWRVGRHVRYDPADVRRWFAELSDDGAA